MNGGGQSGIRGPGQTPSNANERGRGEERERDQQEYYTFLPRQPPPPRPESRASDSASIHFLSDDRVGAERRRHIAPEGGTELLAEDVAQIRLSERFSSPKNKRNHPQPEYSSSQFGAAGMAANGQIDYSPGDFRRAKAAIEDAAARQRERGPPDRLRRVKQIGDTTVITEHRDPYSFYWQLDKLRKAEKEPPRPPPPVDYVLEEEERKEEEEEEEIYEEEYAEEEEPSAPARQQFLSPDSGVHFVEREREEEEGAYAQPVKVTTEDPTSFSHYWHVDSGPRRVEPPPISRRPQPPPPEPAIPPPAVISPPPPEEPAPPIIEEHAFRQTTTKRRIELAEDELEEGGMDGQPFRFKCRWLGQMELENAELDGGERSSQAALNRAMAKLGTNSGRQIWMEIGGTELRLLDENNAGEVLLSEPIQGIRCWAVGNENARDFAFVSRQPGSNGRSICQVFQCEEPAKAVANALSHACNHLLQQQRRPDSLGRRKTHQSMPISPIQEPKRVVRCHFIGVTQVPRATGIEMLNDAVDRLLAEVKAENWTLVDVHISPSAIAIFEAMGARRQIASCRVRYLSFLGIGRDVKHCAFIVAQSADHFVCYVFHAEPSATPLAKTIEAACKLRYQKVLDAHLGNVNGQMTSSPSSASRLGWGF